MALEHLPYLGCVSKCPYDQFVFDGVTAINCTIQKLRVACALVHFDKSTTLPQFVWGDHQARVNALVEQLQEHENILRAQRRKEVTSFYKIALSPCGKVATMRAFLAVQIPTEVVAQSVRTDKNI